MMATGRVWVDALSDMISGMKKSFHIQTPSPMATEASPRASGPGGASPVQWRVIVAGR
jgi:hypothetical protein